MIDIYVKPLKKDEYILLLLKEKLNYNIDLCKIILDIKNSIENKETIEYYIDRWENIAGSHYILHDTHEGKFSYIFNQNDYIIKKDHKPIFYHLTGISYQVVELIHELIKIKNENKEIFSNGVTINIPLPYIEYKDWLKHDDKLYSILSKKIMFEMKKK